MRFYVTHQNVLLNIPWEEEVKRESRAGSIDSPPSSSYSTQLIKIVERGKIVIPFYVRKLQSQEVIQDFAPCQQLTYAPLLFLINAIRGVSSDESFDLDSRRWENQDALFSKESAYTDWIIIVNEQKKVVNIMPEISPHKQNYRHKPFLNSLWCSNSLH